MKKSGYAFFVKRPRVLQDVMRPHLTEQKYPFEVIKTVKLGIIDYENFITDMLADRQFIEDYAGLCELGKVWKCLLVQRRGSSDGILIIPEGGCYVGYAAYFVG